MILRPYKTLHESWSQNVLLLKPLLFINIFYKKDENQLI